MLIGILVGVLLIFGIISLFCGAVKKILEIISVLFRLGVGGMISMMVYTYLGVKFSTQWWMLLFVALGAIIIFVLTSVLAANFRMLGYSINYFSNSFLILIVAGILGENFSVHFAVYALILFLFPRLLWLSDRFATTSEFSHVDYDAWYDITTYHYLVKPMDWWENSGDSWKWIPFQIVVSSLFYLIGSATMTALYPVEGVWLSILFVVLSIGINVAFDLFVFRKIEEIAFGE